MSDVKCARVMYRAAERDVLTLRSMTADAPVESFGFHVQQGAEKALKAWLALLGEKYPLTHSIETLLDILDDRGAAVEPTATAQSCLSRRCWNRFGASWRRWSARDGMERRCHW